MALWVDAALALQLGVRGVDRPTLSSPGELVFLASYAFMAGFLVKDAARGRRRSRTEALETFVIVGGIVSAVALPLVAALQAWGHLGDHDLFAALFYPMVDVALFALVVTQVLVRTRTRSVRSLLLAVGFGVLAVADLSLLMTVGGEPLFGSMNRVVWGVRVRADRPGGGAPPLQPLGAGAPLLLAGRADDRRGVPRPWPSCCGPRGSPPGTSRSRRWSPSSPPSRGCCWRCATPRRRPRPSGCR